MSFETQIAELIDLETLNLKKYTAEYDKRTAFIEGKGKEVDDFILNAENNFRGRKYHSLFIGTVDATGEKFETEKNTFYPVRFKDIDWCQTKTILNVNRSNIHLNNNIHGNWWGSLHFEANFHMSNNGHGSDFLEIVKFKQAINTFIGKYMWHSYAGLILWLRGQTTYHISANGFPYVPTVHMQEYVNNTCGSFTIIPTQDPIQNIVEG